MYRPITHLPLKGHNIQLFSQARNQYSIPFFKKQGVVFFFSG